MRFAPGTSQAQMAAATAAASKPRVKSGLQAAAEAARGGVKQAGIPGRGMPRGGMGKPTFMSDLARAANAAKQQGMAQRAAGSTMSGTKTGLGSTMSGPKTGLGTAMGGFPYVKAPAGGATRAKPPVGGSPQKTSKPTSAVGKAMGMMKEGGSVGSASKRADGIAVKGKTKGKMMSKGGKAC
jgi:hypothetical protein